MTNKDHTIKTLVYDKHRIYKVNLMILFFLQLIVHSTFVQQCMRQIQKTNVKNIHKTIRHKTTPGYILIFTLLITAAGMAIATYIATRGSMYLSFARMAINREKAKTLTIGGIEVACAQLSKPFKKEESKEKKQINKEETKEAAPQDSEGLQLLKTILPTLNRWNSYELTQEIDGIDAQLKICIMCEEGKINLNRIYDFEKKSFVGELSKQPEKVTNNTENKQIGPPPERSEHKNTEKQWRQEIEQICKSLEQTTGAKNLFSAFEKLLKERTTEFNDATELLTLKEFTPLKDALFYEPPSQTEKQSSQQFYLTDIFTVYSSSSDLEPWLLSDSLLALLNLQRAQSGDIQSRKEKINDWLKNFKQQTQWKQEWDTTLAPIYGKELRSLPKNIDSFMSTSFDPHYFSIRVHAKVGDVTQRVYVIVERTKRSEKNNIMYTVTIKKLYWL